MPIEPVKVDGCATIAVAPITYGAGIQNKVLEAMACATPVIVTPQATNALTAIPEKGKANAALVKYLSKKWRLPKTTFSIISGETSRNKVLKIEGDPTALKSLIEADLAANGFYKI